MGRRNALFLVCGLTAALLVVYSVFDRMPWQSLPVEAAVYIEHGQEESEPVNAAVSLNATEPVEDTFTQEKLEQVPVDTTEDCLTKGQLEGHPMFNDELRRAEAIAVSGPQVAAYRGLPGEAVQNFAAQGDSAAMVVLGAISMMRAKGSPENDAIGFLEADMKTLERYMMAASAEDASVHYEEAYQWFYNAALHGRLMALTYAGDALGYARGSAVGLGWVSKDAFEKLKGVEMSALIPANVFTRVMYEISPELRTGLLDFYDLLPRSDAQTEIAKGLAEQFERDRVAARLPPIGVEPSTGPSREALKAMLCESGGKD